MNVIKTTPELLPYLEKIQEEYKKEVAEERKKKEAEAQKFVDKLKIPKELVGGITLVSDRFAYLRIPYLEMEIEIYKGFDSLMRCEKVYYQYESVRCPTLMGILKYILDNKKIEAV